MFDIGYVIEKYLINILGQEVVYFPSVNPKALLVCFSAMDVNNKFNRLSWFWDEEEKWGDGFSILFLSDREYKYYLGDDASPLFHTYEKIILHFLRESGVSMSRTFCVGSSMGGYAAILYAFKMGLGGSIVGVPQVSKSFARMHSYSNWAKCIERTQSCWHELTEILYRQDASLPKLYLEYGEYPADRFAAESLIKIWNDRGGIIILNKGLKNEHVYFMSKNSIVCSAQFFLSVGSVD